MSLSNAEHKHAHYFGGAQLTVAPIPASIRSLTYLALMLPAHRRAPSTCRPVSASALRIRNACPKSQFAMNMNQTHQEPGEQAPHLANVPAVLHCAQNLITCCQAPCPARIDCLCGTRRRAAPFVLGIYGCSQRLAPISLMPQPHQHRRRLRQVQGNPAGLSATTAH